MSYRHTFITSFIYEAPESNPKVFKIFEDWIGSGLVSKVNERGYGFYAGIFKGLYETEYLNDLAQVIPELEKATKVPFRLTVLPECGPAIIYDIRPNPL